MLSRFVPGVFDSARDQVTATLPAGQDAVRPARMAGDRR